MSNSRFTPRVIIESPFAGTGATQSEKDRDARMKLRYLRFCLRDSVMRGEAPFASHAIYTQPWVLDDNDPQERLLGMTCGFVWREVATFTAVYTDLGITDGMIEGIEHADSIGQAVVKRTLDSHALKKVRELLTC